MYGTVMTTYIWIINLNNVTLTHVTLTQLRVYMFEGIHQ